MTPGSRGRALFLRLAPWTAFRNTHPHDLIWPVSMLHAEALARQAGPNDLVICLLSGGGSALLPKPVDGVSLADKQVTTSVLLACGATIHEINTIRKHTSAIKGGLLARAVHPAALVTLVLSDVVGDDLDVIARLDRMDDDFGLDTIEMGATIGVAMEAGLAAFGDSQGAIKLLQEVGDGTPLGRILGNGAAVTGQVEATFSKSSQK